MPRLDSITLRCPDPEGQVQFYTKVLGMTLGDDGTVRYAPHQCGLIFEQGDQPYRPTPKDVYWKIALAVPNIELACEQLTAMGVDVRAPRQFEDVGYLAHFQDPQGFTIELIEHWFQGNRPDVQLDTKRLGGGAALNLLTLRSHDISSRHSEFLAWGMTPLCVQPLQSYGFTLHFYAFTDDTPPNRELTAVENREWVYQRPYTVLEIQEVHGASAMTRVGASESGYAGTCIADSPDRIGLDELMISNAT